MLFVCEPPQQPPERTERLCVLPQPGLVSLPGDIQQGCDGIFGCFVVVNPFNYTGGQGACEQDKSKQPDWICGVSLKPRRECAQVSSVRTCA